MAPANCWPSPAHERKAKPPGKRFSGIYMSVDWSAASSRWCSVMAVRVWPRPSKPSIHGLVTNAVGYTRCATCATAYGGGTRARSNAMPNASIWPATRPRRDLPELLTFFDFPQPLWRKLRTTNAIERCSVEVRRRTRPMVLFVNVASVERIIYAIFHRFNQQWQNRALSLFTQAA